MKKRPEKDSQTCRNEFIFHLATGTATPPSRMVSPVGVGVAVEQCVAEYRRQLVQPFEQFNPAKLGDVDTLLANNQGREEVHCGRLGGGGSARTGWGRAGVSTTVVRLHLST